MINIEKLRVLSLFSGIGSFEKALTNLGADYNIVGFSEIDEYAIEAYCAIHKGVKRELNLGDISAIEASDIPDFDLMTYGFPCQDVSAAGLQKGFSEGSETRSSLLWEAMRVAREKMPKYMIAENVKNLVSKKFKPDFDKWLEELDGMGYNSYWKVLNAKDYKIPQNRERVFVVSVRKDVDQGFEFPKPFSTTGNLADFLEEDATLPILHNIYGGFKESKARVFNEYSPTIRTSSGGGHIPSVVVKGCSLRTRSYMGQPQKLEVRKDDFSNTVTTVPKDFMVAVFNGKDPVELSEIIENASKIDIKGLKLAVKADGNYRLVKDESDLIENGEYLFIREMTNKEAFRLMGFTDEDYEIARKAVNDKFYKGRDRSKTRLYGMAGNSIVVNVCEELFKSLLDFYPHK
ncbi:DNA (cytosine-5-)-methyltransferase [Siminovitchia sp. 179-K 8D1 HS]|uniref:DNA (cytosine-5-)-methyltransferase n=1 Tax=Siminovitchia sp. 179-K 8D1 HS TaxID=3142385 RepID=UPI0039A05592